MPRYYDPEKVKPKIEKYRASLYCSVSEFRHECLPAAMTISDTALARLVNSLAKIGVNTVKDAMNMTDEQVSLISGYSQCKMLRLYREHLAETKQFHLD